MFTTEKARAKMGRAYPTLPTKESCDEVLALRRNVSAFGFLFGRSVVLARPIRGENEDATRARCRRRMLLLLVDIRLDGSLGVSVSSGQADGLEGGTHRMVHRHHIAGWTFGPRSEYARVRVIALFDSCWRYRERERIWTCGNYVKPNAEFDWGYGHSIADQARNCGYPW
jgi:hypothetical protein